MKITKTLIPTAILTSLLFAACSDEAPLPDPVVLEIAVESPTPSIGATGVALDVTLAWEGVVGASDFRVHFGDDLDAVTDADATTGGAETGEETSFTPDEALVPGETYFWRVDARIEGVTVRGPVWSFQTEVEEAPTPPGAVSGPTPEQGAVDVAVDLPELSWAAGEGAQTYTIFLSQTLGEVVAGDTAARISEEQAETSVALTGTLEEGASYFWRVDAVNESGTTGGPVWTFNTAAAATPGDFALTAPEQDAQDVAQAPTLSWGDADGAATYLIFLSEDPLDVIVADEAGDAFQGEQAETALTVAQTLDFGATLFWRVIARNDAGTTSSPISRFTVLSPILPAQTTAPSPADQALAVAVDTALAWEAGEQAEGDEIGALSFDVYFGADFFAVSDADRDSELFLGNQPDATLSFQEALAHDTSFFWRVDAVNETGATRGAVWTFTTDILSDAPRFQGVQSATMIGANALHVAWNSAVDDRDQASQLSYDVFVATTRGGQDFDTPTVTVGGEETSVTLDADALTGLLDNGAVHVVVRARDSEGFVIDNTVEISTPVPVGLSQTFVDASAADGGDGTFEAPFNTLAAGFTAVADGGVLLVAAGVYDEGQLEILGGQNNLHIVGGFPAFGGLTNDEVALLEARQPDTNAAVVNGVDDPLDDATQTLSLVNDHAIDAAGRWLVIDGMTFEDFSTETLSIVAEQVTLTRNLFVGPSQLSRVRDGQGQGPFYESSDVFVNAAAVVLQHATQGAPIQLVMVGNRFNGGNGGVRCQGAVSAVHVGANHTTDMSAGLLIGRRVPTDDVSELLQSRTWSIPAEGMDLTFEGNSLRRSRNGLADLSFEALDANVGVELNIHAHHNRALGVITGDVFRFREVGLTGAGGAATLLFHDNDVIGVQGSLAEISHALVEVENVDLGNGPQFVERVEVQGDLDVKMLNNSILHTNDNGLEINNMLPPEDGTVEIEFRGNRAGPLESEGVDINAASIFNNSPDPVVPSLGRNGAVRILVADNRFDSVDEFVELRLRHLPEGDIDIDVIDNVSLRDEGDCIDIDIANWTEGVEAQGIRSDIDVVVARNHCEGEDDFAEIDIESTPGEASLLIEDNTCLVEQGGIDLDFRFPALQQNDELIEAQTGASRVVIRNNTMTVDTDGIEGSWREVRADSEFVVVNNDIRSLDDLGIDVDVFSVARTVIANNVMRSHDEGVIELRGFNRGGTSSSTFDPDLGRNVRVDQPNLNWPMDLIIWNNDTHVAHNENIEVRWDMYSAEGNVYIAQNDAWGNTESEALDVALTEGAAALIERNITGFNDVDSSAAMQFGCKGAVQAIARNNIALWGAGAGILANNCVLQLENNTVAFNNRDNSSSFGIENVRMGRGDANNEFVFFDNLDDPYVEGFGQSFITNSLTVHNTNHDTVPGVQRSHNWSLISERSNPNEGFEVIVADPQFEFCDPQSRNFIDCTRLKASSPAIDAGDPDPRYNDTDGTRNDIGHTGGPHAGPMGYQGEPVPVPQAAIGLRPLSALGEGARPLPTDSALHVVFSLPLGEDFDATLLTVVNLDDDAAIDGTWTAAGNRATFTPSGALPAGAQLEVRVDSGVGSDRGPATDRRHRFTALVDSAESQEVEPNNATDEAQTLTPRSKLSGTLDPFGDANDSADFYALSVTRGQRLTASAFAAREGIFNTNSNIPPVPVLLRLTLLSADGETLLNLDINSVSRTNPTSSNQIGTFPSTVENLNEIASDPYLSHVFQQDGTVFLRVDRDPNGALLNGGEGGTPYELFVNLR